MAYSEKIDKWREHLVDINKIEFNNKFKIIEEVSYPHASNEITEVIAKYNGVIGNYIIKVSRRKDSYLERESEILSLLSYESTPSIILEGVYDDKYYVVMNIVEGRRMSMLNKDGLLTLEHLKSFGESLAKIHQMDIQSKNAPHRTFHDTFEFDEFINNYVNPWLNNNIPLNKELCFCHGDHHYANVLFRSKDDYTVLDWELAGIGFKEFDMAWAMILRPGQEFFKTVEEEIAFIEGYSNYSSFNTDHYKWAKVLVAAHFYKIGTNNENIEYAIFLKKVIKRIIDKR